MAELLVRMCKLRLSLKRRIGAQRQRAKRPPMRRRNGHRLGKHLRKVGARLGPCTALRCDVGTRKACIDIV